jgi:PASTA domain
MTADEKTLGEQMTTWQIGESGTELVLDGDGEGEVTFTVTNAGQAQDRAVLTVTPLDGAAEDWFAVDEPQRAVAPGASVVYPVTVKVPPGTAAGTYGLQGVAYSADTDPSESSVTSKRVGITVPPPPPKKGIPKWIFLVIAAVLLLIIGLVVFLLTRGGGGLENEEPPEVPAEPAVLQSVTAEPGVWSEDDVAFEFQWQRCDRDGDDCDDIEDATQQTFLPGAREANLTLRVEVTATAADGDDTATATSDASGQVAPVDLSTVPVPPVIGLTRSSAVAQLTAAGFVVAQEVQGATAGECNPVVIDQRPPGNTPLAQAQIVTIITRPEVVNIQACGLSDFEEQIRLPVRAAIPVGPIPEEFTRDIAEEAL